VILTVVVLSALAALSFGLSIWQFAAAMGFGLQVGTRCRASGPTGRSALPGSREGAMPSVSVLKPLQGCDAETRECLRSWLTQVGTADVEVLFGVENEDDPVCEIVRGLIKEHPRCVAQLVICAERLGPNPKVSKLAQLARLARHEVICASDADVRVAPDFLACATAQLNDPNVGLVNCFYRFANSTTFAMRWESFAVNADFWGQVLQSVALKPMDFALGAVMIAPRARLECIGGFDALVEFLADDYELGQRIAQSGARVALAPVVVDCWTGPMRFAEVWAHQLRWARTIRVCRPGPYFLSILGNATFWPLLLALAAPSALVTGLVATGLVWRMAQGFVMERKFTGRGRIDSLWMALVKDILQVGLWAAAFAGRQVLWRGERMRVDAKGRLARQLPGQSV
jgi:ceramide glucosyltransferase